METEQKYSAPAISKLLDILEQFAVTDTPLSVNELARLTGNSVNSVYRICLELERRDYLQKEFPAGQYQLGIGFYRIGRAAERRMELRSRAIGLMSRLRDASGETVHLTVLRENRLLLLEQCETGNPIKIHVETGTLLYPHGSAFGKCILAYLPEEELERIIESGLPALTANTIVDRGSLLRELERIRREKLAYDQEEYMEGVVCVGAPVFGADGRVIAAVGISCPKYRLPSERLEFFRMQVQDTAAQLSCRMGMKEDAADGTP